MSVRRTLYSGWIGFKFACLASILITTSGLAQTKTDLEPSTTPQTKVAVEAVTIYVTSIEHFQTILATGYKVEAQTTDADPKVDYRLACGLNAGALQTGQRYRVE